MVVLSYQDYNALATVTRLSVCSITFHIHTQQQLSRLYTIPSLSVMKTVAVRLGPADTLQPTAEIAEILAENISAPILAS